MGEDGAAVRVMAVLRAMVLNVLRPAAYMHTEAESAGVGSLVSAGVGSLVSAAAVRVSDLRRYLASKCEDRG